MMRSYNSNLWHIVLPGKDSPEYVNSIIEIPEGSKGKYELDKESGLLKLDRVFFFYSSLPGELWIYTTNILY